MPPVGPAGLSAWMPMAWELGQLEMVARSAGRPAMSEGQALPPADLTASTPGGTDKVGSSGWQTNALEGKALGCQDNIYTERKLYSFCLCCARRCFSHMHYKGVDDHLPQSAGEGCCLLLLSLVYMFSSNILYFTLALYFFPLLPPLTGLLADSDAFYGATTQLCCEQKKIF